MPRVRLVCWREDLSRERARLVEEAGFAVDASPLNPSGLVGHLRANMPAAILIDLDRLPSQGQGVATIIRRSQTTRRIPIVFAGGAPEKVERVRSELPDAYFTSWNTVARALKRALRSPAVEPVRPPPPMARYTGSSLIKKLGLKPDMAVALLGAPEGFEETLGDVPDGVELKTRLTGNTRLVIWFVRSRQELTAEMKYFGARLPQDVSIWIVYPKQKSRYSVDFTQYDVRAAGLAVGLVDYKVCAVDADWTGLKFARKKAS